MVKQQWGCIYRLTNTINGKKYIGKTVEFKNRMRSHKNSKDECYIHRAIQKYGWNKFKVEKIIDNVPEEDLNNLEISYIAVENTKVPYGMNLTDGGEGVSGFVPSAKTREKHRQNMKLRMSKRTREEIERVSYLRWRNRKHFGSISFEKKYKKWKALGPGPEQNYIGQYFTKEKATKALDHYNSTGERLESDTNVRKKGTGTIKRKILKRNGKTKFQGIYSWKKKRAYKTFDTVEECENWLKKMYELSIRPKRKLGTGCIEKSKNGKRYKAGIIKKGKKKSKTFDTIEECENWLKNADNLDWNNTKKRRKMGTGSIFKLHSGRCRATFDKNKKTKSKTFDTVEECENWLKIMYNN